MFCSIMNFFTATFDQLNASFINNNINFLPQTFERKCISVFNTDNNKKKKSRSANKHIIMMSEGSCGNSVLPSQE